MTDNRIFLPKEIAKRESRRRRRRHEESFADYRVITTAKVSALNGSIDVPNRPGHVWVSTLGLASSRYAAYNPGFSLIDQVPVEIASSPQKPFRWIIIDVYVGDIVPQNGALPSSFNLPNHAQNHQHPAENSIGKDVMVVYQPAVDMLKSRAIGGMNISVSSLVFQHRDFIYTYPGVSSFDLTPYIPATASTHQKVLVYLNKTTKTIQATAGTAVTTGASASNPALPGGSVASSIWDIANGHTVLSMTADYEDARSFLAYYDDTADTPVPEEAGQILFALSAAEFTPERPAIDEDTGNLIVDEDTWTLVMEG